jgi:TRAP-type C4-dicarboxylate transport system permease small subunit
LKILSWLDENFEKVILSLLLTVIASVMMLEVIMRYVFNSSVSWAEEASRYAFVWSALVSIGYSIKEQSILKVDTLIEALPTKVRNMFVNVSNLVVTLFFGYLFWVSIPAVSKVIRTGQKSPALGIPMGLIYFAAIVGFFLATLRSIQKMYRNFVAARKGSI